MNIEIVFNAVKDILGCKKLEHRVINNNALADKG
jgi:hypothetical protein